MNGFEQNFILAQNRINGPHQTKATARPSQSWCRRLVQYLNVNQPVKDFIDGLAAIRNAPQHQVQATLGKKILMRRVVFFLAGEVPSPAHTKESATVDRKKNPRNLFYSSIFF